MDSRFLAADSLIRLSVWRWRALSDFEMRQIRIFRPFRFQTTVQLLQKLQSFSRRVRGQIFAQSGTEFDSFVLFGEFHWGLHFTVAASVCWRIRHFETSIVTLM